MCMYAGNNMSSAIHRTLELSVKNADFVRNAGNNKSSAIHPTLQGLSLCGQAIEKSSAKTGSSIILAVIFASLPPSPRTKGLIMN